MMEGFSNRPRFSGYSVTPEAKARLFLSGHTKYKNTRVEAEYVLPSSVTDTVEVRKTSLEKQNGRWQGTEDLPLGTQYRILVNGKPKLDYAETVQRSEGAFNVISPLEATAPRKSGNIADIFLDTLVSDLKLQGQLNEAGEAKIRDHFNQFGGDEKGIQALLPMFRKAGFSSILLKPFIGGDNLSSHRYWTKDPFVLNSSFSSKAAFKETLRESLHNGMTFFADGAFVNQGLNGIQYAANLEHGFRSPYWDWFLHDEPRPLDQPLSYPRLAFEKPSVGILPTQKDANTGTLEPNHSRYDFRVLNDPKAESYQADRPTYIELYDPTVETAEGQPLSERSKTRTSEDSVQHYRFKVSPKQLDEKRQQSLGLSDAERKAIWREWDGFRLETASHDDSMFKWDGQIDVAKMNMKNPEVRVFLKQAMAYWTRTVKNTYLQDIAQGLSRHVNPDKPNWPAALEKITATTEAFEADKLPQGTVLPPITMPDIETVTPSEIREVLGALKPAGTTADEALANWAVKHFPLGALELPEPFKAILTIPDLQARFSEARLPVMLRFLSPLERVSILKPWIERLKSPSFEAQLAETVAQSLNDGDTLDKLAYDNTRQLAGDDVAETLYLQLLTGQTSRDREAIETGFYKTVPAYIRNADPLTGARLLEDFLKKRLKQSQNDLPQALESQLKSSLRGVTPQSLAVAEWVADKRELGLNWRIDAAKDVADMDFVREADPADREARFRTEMDFVKSFWADMMGSIRDISPKAVVIPEWTDFELLSNPKAAKEITKSLYENNTFNGSPNMQYLFSPAHQLVHYAQRPDEFGASQMKPSDFVKSVIQPMTQSVPVPVSRQHQNLTASHDYMTSSHTMLMNPAILTQDHLKWWGLKDDLKEISDELASKDCFTAERNTLRDAGVADLNDVLGRLNYLANSPEVRERFSDDAKTYLDEHTKKNNSAWEPTPREMKGRFVEELFSQVSPEALGLSAKAHEALKSTVMTRMHEPSEARAMRAVISNALLALEQLGELPEVVKPELYRALNAVAQSEGAHWGYQPLDVALDNWFAQVDASRLPADMGTNALKARLYETAMAPVYEKMQRVFAVQIALPGNPSIYLPDLFAQGGGELIKNIYVQNRNLIRHDRVATQSSLKDFTQQSAALLKLRSKLPVLNDGFVQPIPADDAAGVLPIVRDNGKQQAIVLVNTGKPGDIGWDKVGNDVGYKQIQSQQPVLNDYKLSLKDLKQPAGTAYVDVENGERFVVDARGQLVSAENRDKGVDIGIYRVLVREE